MKNCLFVLLVSTFSTTILSKDIEICSYKKQDFVEIDTLRQNIYETYDKIGCDLNGIPHAKDTELSEIDKKLFNSLNSSTDLPNLLGVQCQQMKNGSFEWVAKYQDFSIDYIGFLNTNNNLNNKNECLYKNISQKSSTNLWDVDTDFFKSHPDYPNREKIIEKYGDIVCRGGSWALIRTWTNFKNIYIDFNR